MQRVEAFVSGVRGAENGSFSAVLRGTSTPATYYTDFEGTSSATATGVALDQYGGKIVFFDRLVTITAYSAGGSIIRTWTAGDDAGAVELKSASFNGAAYSNGAVAAGNPTTVEAAMDKWVTSAGAVDFKVLLNGSSTNLSSAFSAIAGLRYFVVTDPAYGAVGDGVTNDTSAVQAAISAAIAASGGVVFFPKGTYLINSNLAVSSAVSLQGYSADLSIIKQQSGSASVMSGSAPAAVRNLSFTFSSSNYTGTVFSHSSGVSIHDTVSMTQGVVSGTYFGGTAALDLRNSYILLKSTGVLVNTTGSTFSAFNSIFGSTEDVALSGTVVTAADISVIGSTLLMFDFAAGGTRTGFMLNSTSRIFAAGLRVLGPRTATVTVFNMNTNGRIYDNGTYIDANTPANVTTYGSGVASSSGYSLGYLGSRNSFPGAVSANNDPFTVPARQYRLVTANVTNAAGWTGNCQMAIDTAPAGSDLLLSVWNDTAGALTFEWSTGVEIAGGTTFAVAANSSRQFLLVSRANASAALAWFLVSSTAGAEVVE